MEINKMIQYSNPLFFRYLLIHSEKIRKLICKELNHGKVVKEANIINKKHYSHLMNHLIMEDENNIIYMVELQNEISDLDYMTKLHGYQGFLFQERIIDKKRHVKVLVIHYQTNLNKPYRIKESISIQNSPFLSYEITTIELDFLQEILNELDNDFNQLMYLLKVGKVYDRKNVLFKEVTKIHEQYLKDKDEEIRYFYYLNDRTLLKRNNG